MNGLKKISFAFIFATKITVIAAMASTTFAADKETATVPQKTEAKTAKKTNAKGAKKPAHKNAKRLNKAESKAKIKQAFELSRKVTAIHDLDQILLWLDEVNTDLIAEKEVAYVRTLEGWALNSKAKRLVDDIERYRRIERDEDADESLQNAIDTFTLSIQKDPQRNSSFRQRGVLYAMQKDFGKAIEDFDEAIRLQADDQKTWFNRAEIRYEQKAFAAAADDYSQALQLKSDDAQAFTGRGHCQLKLGQFDKAINDYLSVTKLTPKNTDAFTNLADAYQADQQWAKSAETFRTALMLSEDNPRAYTRVAWLYATCPDASQRKPQIAMQAIKRSIKLTGGETAGNLDVLAATFAANGDFASAAKAQERAIKLSKRDDKSMKERLARFGERQQYLQDNTKIR